MLTLCFDHTWRVYLEEKLETYKITEIMTNEWNVLYHSSDNRCDEGSKKIEAHYLCMRYKNMP